MIADEITRSYFSMEETAKALGVAESAIRYYDETFNLQIHRGANGIRKLTADDVGKVALIVRLSKFMHKDGIRRALAKKCGEDILNSLGDRTKEVKLY